jgi:polysaccharide deacetylase 2 family uncharacterized protein YibQ
MGSRITADPALMSLILEEIRQRDHSLFFLDSSTTPFSVVSARGRLAGVSVLVNNLFLDGTTDVDIDPHAQVARLEEIARKRGTAIAIGHAGEETVKAAREAMVRWKNEGIELVTLSRLVGRQSQAVPRPAS